LRFRFASRKLEALYTAKKGIRKLPPEIADAFFEVMAVIVAASDERDFYAVKSLHYEKLSGNRAGDHSMRLNDQWRLIVHVEEDDEGKYVIVISLVDYH
jgi:toxin HigB-1